MSTGLVEVLNGTVVLAGTMLVEVGTDTVVVGTDTVEVTAGSPAGLQLADKKVRIKRKTRGFQSPMGVLVISHLSPSGSCKPGFAELSRVRLATPGQGPLTAVGMSLLEDRSG
jgi:hypothetical protein